MLNVILLAVFATLGGFASARGGDDCPDQVVDPKPGDARYGRERPCSGGSLNLSHGGVRYTVRQGTCPDFVIIVPPHDATKHRPGSNTWTKPSGQVAITLITFSCSTDWFLFIPTGSSCRQTGSRVVSRKTHYDQLPCFIDDPDQD